MKIHRWYNVMRRRYSRERIAEFRAEAARELVAIDRRIKEATMKRMIDQITPENIHGETETGEPVGNEHW